MQDNKQKDLTNHIYVSDREIIELRNKLNQLNDQKEALFSKKKIVSGKIKELISIVRAKREKRNKLTDSVKEEKTQRGDLNLQIRTKIDEIKALKEQCLKTGRRLNVRENPQDIKERINRLNEKIETEVISFEKEQQTMKQIKELKKRYDELVKVSSVWDEVGTLSKEIDTLKIGANQKHTYIQEKAKVSQEQHEIVLDISKKIDELKIEEKQLNEKFAEKKKEFNQINDLLKEKLTGLGKQPFYEPKQDKKQKRKEQLNQSLKEKQVHVQEKLKSGQKITTEDLLIIQSQTDSE